MLTPGAWLFGDALWPARLVNVLLGSLVVVLAAVLARRVAGPVAGWATAVVVGLYPPLLANDTVTLTEPLALALLLGTLLLIDDERWAWAGVTTGLVLLTRPNGYLVVLVFAAWVWRRVGPRRAAAFVGIAVLVLVPWLVRNKIQVDTFGPTTSDGFTLAAVYAPPAQAAGTFVDPVFSPAYDGWDDRFLQFDEHAWDRHLTRSALDGIRDHPRYVLTTVDRNVRGFFELDPDQNRWPELNDGRSWRMRTDALPAFYAVTALGLVGLAGRRRDDRVVVLAVLVAQFVGLSLLLVAPPRLRAPFDLACAIGVGLLVERGWRWWRGIGRSADVRDADLGSDRAEPSAPDRSIDPTDTVSRPTRSGAVR